MHWLVEVERLAISLCWLALMTCGDIVSEGYKPYYCSFLPTTIMSLSAVVLSVLLSMFRRSASAGSRTALCAQMSFGSTERYRSRTCICSTQCEERKCPM